MVFCCKITIGNYTFDSANEIEINKTWKKFTQTAIIKIPRKLTYQIGKSLQQRPVENLKDFIKKGDKVKIELGYNRIFKTEFEGYVITSPVMGIPYEIECQDEMWILKNKTVSIHIEDATVRQILQEAAPGYQIDCVDELYGDFSLSEVTPVKVFDELKRTSGLYTFFRNKRIVCGIPYSDKLVSTQIPTYTMGQNIIDTDIQFKYDEEAQIKVYGSSKQNSGILIKFDKGEQGGTRINLHFDHQLTLDQLKKAVEDKYSFNKKMGNVTGGLKTFGLPFIEHGQVVRYVDKIKEEIDEKLFIDEITINVSATIGYKKTLKFGKIQTA